MIFVDVLFTFDGPKPSEGAKGGAAISGSENPHFCLFLTAILINDSFIPSAG